MKFFQSIGAKTIGKVTAVGRAALMLFGALIAVPRIKNVPLVIKQWYVVGVQSLLIIMVSGLFIGMVMALQGYTILVDYGAEGSLGPMVALSLLRELGPVVTALLFAGRAGSALTAEIGLMKATDHLSAMEMMAIDPLPRVFVPRFLGGVIAMPMLVAIFSAIGLFGAHVVGVSMLGVDAGACWQQMQSGLDITDIQEGIVKSVVFGVVVSLLAVWEGYSAIPTAEGVGRATTRTVVISAIAILILDFMITALSI